MHRAELTMDGAKPAMEPLCGCGLLGALKCVAGMEGLLPLIHGPVSCSSGHRLAMLYAGVEPLLPTTCIEQTHVVLGSAERLSHAMDKAWHTWHPEILLVLLSCAAAMTGDDYRRAIEAYSQKTGKKALVLDGSALAGDEVDICPKLYESLCAELNIIQGVDESVALDGFAMTDYGFQENQPAMRALVEASLKARYVPGLFAGSDVITGNQYRNAKKAAASLLWDRKALNASAPIGVRGSFRYVKYLSESFGLKMKEEAAEIYEAWQARLAPIAQTLRRARLSVAIEGAGWYAYALADYLKNDLGCKVMLSVDREAPSIAWNTVCDEFYEDTGRFELVELIEEFGAKVAFGSSNIQSDGSWSYIPFFQPVWRVVEPTAMLGYEASVALAQRLLREAER